MFNVTRSTDEPESLSRSQSYKEEDVIEALRRDFHNKCYLCERNAVQDVEVEHFIPQAKGGDPFDWSNLFYSCRRCNGIKSSRHTNLLDCTNPDIDVFNSIRLRASLIPDLDVQVTSTSEAPCEKEVNTVRLLSECYNNQSTSLRKISRAELMESIFEKMFLFISNRMILKDISSSEVEKQKAEGVLSAMMDKKHPYSAFWRWQYLDDSYLTREYPHLRENFT